MPHLSGKIFIFLWHIYLDTIDKICSIGNLCRDIDGYRCIFHDFSFDEHQCIDDWTRISTGLLKGYLEYIYIESPTWEIFDLFRIENSIGHEDYFSFITHDFCIVEIDFFDDPFEIFDSDRLSDLKGPTHDNGETSEEIRDNILAREGENHSSYPCTSKESTSIDSRLLEDDKSSSDPDKQKYDKTDRREEFSYHKVFHRESIFDLVTDATHNIGNDEDDEKSSKDNISLIDMGPGIWSKIKHLRWYDHLIEDHYEGEADNPGDQIPQMCYSIFHRKKSV